jgi:hypothetical protein
MKSKEAVWLALIASLLGLLVLKWEWLAQLLGVAVAVERSGSMITMEYLFGLVAVAALGFAFYRAPVWCAVWFMLGPTIVASAIHIARIGVPNQLMLEIVVLAILTLPYIGVAYGAAYLRRHSL